MAVFYPSFEEICSGKTETPTISEMALLVELNHLPNDFNVYYKPQVSFACPKIVVERPSAGLLIIEINDWDLGSYEYINEGNETDYITRDGVALCTSFEQVENFKKDCFEEWCLELFLTLVNRTQYDDNGRIKRPFFSQIKTGVFFFRATTSSVKQKYGDSQFKYKDLANQKQLYYRQYTACWTIDDLSEIHLKIQSMLINNVYYDGSIHEAVINSLNPVSYRPDQLKQPELTNEKKQYIHYEEGERQRIRGMAGSGKTLLIAKKAVTCYEETHKQVLILVYNITIKRYIYEYIVAFTPNMDDYERAAAFKILHFDRFIPQMLRKYGIKEPNIEDYIDKFGNVNFSDYRRAQLEALEQNNSVIKPFPIILLDEAQDFTTEWFGFLYKVFISKDTDYFMVADEKQNIYQRDTDEGQMPRVPGMKGRWRELKTSHRMTSSGLRLSIAFQHKFMNEYNYDAQFQINMLTYSEKRCYYSIEALDYNRIYSYIISFCRPIPLKEVCILSLSIGVVRDIDYYFRSQGHSTHTMCETSEMNEELRNRYGVDDASLSDDERNKRIKQFKKDLYIIRSYKKEQFDVNEDAIKICTVHSFKGLEIKTVVLIISGKDKEIIPEKIYAGITRTKENLLVISCRENIYHNFFQEELNGTKRIE